ncbi:MULTISPECIES: hydrogenase/urease nickel incorporation protein HypA [Helicobacter]|uniref:Hydrogenase maturation factor HypA n=1 Tax=Helicobacter ibis TaxID=2962633 RepID=A0ABT4VCY4_9HELI|nr:MULTISPECIES: hydrogenase/urease nickel incorporation protein HypA [Helicobacter]MDA3966684.1 hydrogenase/urease nickel incorporation protein HypA [Helicobacter sp. WB40]MDA3968548.1 hydrogenase/urease nickel incorporation protein HypA [Helicobacter ibis]
MHEFSVVSSLLDNCEKIAISNNATKILSVYVQIGERSGVNPKLLKSAFEEFKIGGICCNAKLFIEYQKVVLECKKCGSVYESKEIEYVKCDICKEESLSIVAGNEMLLMRLEME